MLFLQRLAIGILLDNEMNQFLTSTLYFITKHGVDILYKSKGVAVYNPTTQKSTSTDASHAIKSYPKHIRATQFNFPSLVGKSVVMFYVANSGLTFTPKVSDEIVYDGAVYKVTSLQSHAALGEICLYKIIAVKD